MVKTGDYIQEDFEKRKNEYVLDFIRKKELINSNDNVIFSQKIFVINSVIKWCLDKIQNKKMSTTQWAKYKKIISQYIAGIVDLKWNDGSLEIIEVKHGEKRTTRSRRTKRRN
jgi:hypothetical protein